MGPSKYLIMFALAACGRPAESAAAGNPANVPQPVAAPSSSAVNMPPSAPPEQAPSTTPDTPPAPPRAGFARPEVERVDCKAKGAPAWCRKVKYATKNEREGTMAVVLRSDSEGELHWCSRGLYVSEVGDSTRVPPATLKELGARMVTLEPRDGDHASSDAYFVVPPGVAFDVKWMGPCPVE